MISKRTIGWVILAALLAAAAQSPVLGKDVPAASGAGHLPALSIRTISSLSPTTDTNASSRICIQGTIVAQHLGEYVVINDGTGTVFADLQPVVSLKIKDVVEVVGTPVWEGSQFHLRNTSFTVRMPEAKAVTNASEPSLVRPVVLPLLTKAWHIRDLPAEKAAWKYPVQLSGVVTYFEKNNRFCIQDDISGITVQFPNLNRNLNLEIGELVDVEGWSDPGAYAPIVIASKVVSRGMVPLPEPRQVTIYQLNNDQEGSQWVELTGIVHAESFTNGQITLILSDPTGRISVSVMATSNAPSLLDSIVRVRGISGSTSNDRRQFLAAKILVPSLKFVQVEEPAVANPFDLPVRTILSLTQFRPRLTLERRVNVSGVVTFCQPGQWLYLQDATDGLQVFTTQTDGIRPGTRIKAAGYPASASYGT
ncbi:MAG TPA: hypothetical protein VK327_09350, partial [Candidatus Paceibacterota bacterium]|nr:hypothetical protein [Candidatus Paceibacterota bacterium]